MSPTITQPPAPAPAVPAEIIATSIVQIAEGMKALNNTRLSRRALVTLIHDHSKVSRKEIELVLNNLTHFEAIWLKPRAAKKA